MSQIISRIEDHPYRTTSDSVISRLEELKELEGLNENEFDTITRIEEVYKIIHIRISSIDTMLLSKNVLDGLSNNSSEINKQLTAIIQHHRNNNMSQKTANINRINELLDSVTIQITQIYQPLVPTEVEALKESIVSTRQSLSQHNRYIKEEYEGFSTAKKEIEGEIEGFSSRLSSIEAQVTKTVENATDQISDFERMFSEKQQERTEEFTNFKTEWTEKINEELNSMKDAFSKKIEDVEEEFTQYKARLDSRMEEHEADVQVSKEELYDLIEVAGNDVMSDGYAKYANKASNSKLIWQVVSVFCLIGLVGAAYSIIPSLETETFSWSTLAARSLLTVSVGGLAGFTIRQAHLSHLEEQHNRDMQLKLGSIEPYLKNFPTEKRNEIKEKLVADYFSKEGINQNNHINFESAISEKKDEKTTA